MTRLLCRTSFLCVIVFGAIGCHAGSQLSVDADSTIKPIENKPDSQIPPESFAGDVVVEGRLLPRCIASYCFGNVHSTREDEIHNRFGGAGKTVLWNKRSYCYLFGVDQEGDYGFFRFANHGSSESPEWELETIRVSRAPICENPHRISMISPLLTKEGIGIGSDASQVIKIYGKPNWSRKSSPYIEDFFGKFKNSINIDSVSMYTADDKYDLTAASFYYSNGKVIGIDVSYSE